jgi:hypothetical protein
VNRPAADNPTHRRIARQPVRIVHILVASEPPKHGLTAARASGEESMEVIYLRCALDVHKETVVACVRIVEKGEVTRSVRTFTTTTASLSEWLEASGWKQVAARTWGWKRPEYIGNRRGSCWQTAASNSFSRTQCK